MAAGIPVHARRHGVTRWDSQRLTGIVERDVEDAPVAPEVTQVSRCDYRHVGHDAEHSLDVTVDQQGQFSSAV